MSKLLVSVRSVREAELVMQLGIGILDVKEPSRGGLGASDPETLEGIAEVVRGSNVPIDMSFSAGELVQWCRPPAGKGCQVDSAGASHQNLVQQYGLELVSQFRFAKVGLAGATGRRGADQIGGGGLVDGGESATFDWRNAWRQFFADLPSPTRSVAVAYLDFRDCQAPAPTEVIQLAAEAEHCDAVLFDTHYKSGKLFSHVSITELHSLVQTTRRLGLRAVVAGSVGLDCLPDVVAGAPDFIGVRGAVCRGDRTGRIDPSLVEQFVKELRGVVSN